MDFLKYIRLFCLAFCLPFVWSTKVYVATVDSAITPPTLSYIDTTIQRAEQNNAQAVIIKLDTPGGLLTTTRDIGQRILTSRIPVITYVSPQGARAASAGTFILYASHIAAMAPSTHLGSATPISLGANEEEQSSAAEAKVLNDSIAYIKTLAEYHNRNQDFAIEAVQNAVSITAKEAQSIGAIEIVASDISTLLAQADGMRVRMQNGYEQLDLSDPTIIESEPTLKERILIAISDPSIAYLMLMTGIYGIMIELFNPGSIFPGVLGAICLLIASYSLQILPMNYAGIGLIALGTIFLVAESFIPSFGILGIAGVISIIVGGFLISQLPSWASPDLWLLTLLLAGFILGILWLIRINLRAQLNPPASGQAALLGQTVRVIQIVDHGYEVLISGEIWQADSFNDQALTVGSHAVVYGIEGLRLKIKPLEDHHE